MNQYIDETGGLTSLGLETYINAMHKDKVDEIPDALYNHVQNSPECLEKIIDNYPTPSDPIDDSFSDFL